MNQNQDEFYVLEGKKEKQPILCVYMPTYNHKNFIVQSIEGVLSQKTRFPFLLILSDDASSDGTREICLDYYNANKDKMELLFARQNSKMRIARPLFERCFASGAKYIAICEGDDYWTDPLKLQKQVDILEKHPEYSGVFHKASILRNGELSGDEYVGPVSIKSCYTLEDHITRTGTMPTASLVFRNANNLSVDYIRKFPVGDFPLILSCLKNGSMAYIDEIMSVYRVHSNSIFSSSSILKRTLIELECYNIIAQEPEIYSMLRFHQARISTRLRLNEILLNAYQSEKGQFLNYFISTYCDMPISVTEGIMREAELDLSKEYSLVAFAEILIKALCSYQSLQKEISLDVYNCLFTLYHQISRELNLQSIQNKFEGLQKYAWNSYAEALKNWFDLNVKGSYVLFGGGSFARKIIAALREDGNIPLPSAIADDAPSGNELQGIKLLHPEELNWSNISTVILATDTYYEQFRQRVLSFSNPSCRILVPLDIDIHKHTVACIMRQIPLRMQ